MFKPFCCLSSFRSTTERSALACFPTHGNMATLSRCPDEVLGGNQPLNQTRTTPSISEGIGTDEGSINAARTQPNLLDLNVTNTANVTAKEKDAGQESQVHKKSTTQTPASKYEVAQINLARSPLAWEDLKLILDEHDMDIIPISEPPAMLQAGRTLPLGYDWAYHNCETSSGAGILYKRRLRLTKPIGDTDRTNTVCIRRASTDIWITSFYLEPGTLDGIDSLYEVSMEAKTQHKIWIAGGDANAHSTLWGPSETNEGGKKMEEFLLTADLVLHNDPDSPPTFQRTVGSPQWLDLTVSSVAVEDIVHEWQVRTDDIPNSDHQMIYWTIDGQLEMDPEPKTWAWNRADWPEFRQLLQSMLPDPRHHLTTPAQVDQQTWAMTRALQSTIRCVIPRLRRQAFPKHWYDNEMSKLRARLRRSQKGTQQHAELRRQWKSKASQKKLESFKRFTEEVDENTCWDALRRLSARTRILPITALRTGENIISDPLQIARHLSKRYFPDLEDPAQERHMQDITNEMRLRYDATPIERQDLHWTVQDVWEELSRTRRKTSPGPDDIPYVVLRQCVELLAEPLTLIYNAILDTGHYPEAWKEGNVCNIKKPGRSGEEAKHYRPITLLNCLGKVFETLLARRLNRWAEEKHILPDSQYGFRRGRTTIQPLKAFSDSIWRSINQRKSTTAVSLDLEGAYDRVVPAVLLQRLEAQGLDHSYRSLLWHMLDRRSNNIEANGRRFPHRPNRGLPQGSPLSPLLYILYRADLPSFLPATVNLLQYADDILIYTETDTPEDERSLQNALDGIRLWCQRSAMRINIEKTQLITIRRNRDRTLPVLGLGEYTIPHRTQLRYLGILFDSRMSFQEHMTDKIVMASPARSIT